MSDLKFDVDIDTHDLEDKLQRKANLIGPYALKYLNDMARDVENHVKKEAPHKTGRLKSSISHKLTGYGAVVYANEGIAPYVDWVIDGRGPVTATNKQALHFTIDGKEIFATRVKASKPNPFFERAYESAQADISKRTDTFVKWVIDL